MTRPSKREIERRLEEIEDGDSGPIFPPGDSLVEAISRNAKELHETDADPGGDDRGE